MKLITRNTDYSVRALIFIAKAKEEIVSVSELVKSLKIPRPFLRKILQQLNKKGILKSYKGKGGGFTLVVPPRRIFLVDLMEVFQGPLELNECIFKKRICPDRDTCALKEKIDDIEEKLISKLRLITIEDLTKGKGDGRWPKEKS